MQRDKEYPDWFLWLWRMGPLGYIIAALAVIGPILAIAWHLDTRLARIEDELRFEPPPQYSPPDLAARAVKDLTEDQVAVKQLVYVPVYSHVYYHGGRPCLLEATLSIHNTDVSRSIYVGSVRYYDTRGELKRTHVDQAVRLAPLETLQFLVEEHDTVGGSGANFLVEWMAEESVSEPLIETVMVGAVGRQGISFSCSGRTVRVASQPAPEGKTRP